MYGDDDGKADVIKDGDEADVIKINGDDDKADVTKDV